MVTSDLYSNVYVPTSLSGTFPYVLVGNKCWSLRHSGLQVCFAYMPIRLHPPGVGWLRLCRCGGGDWTRGQAGPGEAEWPVAPVESLQLFCAAAAEGDATRLDDPPPPTPPAARSPRPASSAELHRPPTTAAGGRWVAGQAHFEGHISPPALHRTGEARSVLQ